MLFDYANEKLVLFSSPRQYWPVEPVPAMVQFHRWRVRGLLDPNGVRVQLETMKLGGRRYTSHEAVARFIAATNGEKKPQISSNRAKEAARALDAILDARSKKRLPR